MKSWQLPISYLARGSGQSWLGRHFLLAWHVVVLLASWYPFRGWRYTGEGIFAFYTYPLPYYQTSFDNVINVLAYMPIGYAWALTFRCRWHSPLMALLFGATLSAGVEFVQQFLPDRVASNLDILCNTTGALLGALIACALNKLMLMHRWHVFRQLSFAKGPLVDFGLIVMLLWLIAQMNPAVPLFGIVVEPNGIPQAFTAPISNPALFLHLLETLGVLLHLTAVGLMATTLLARRSRAAWAVGSLLVSTTAMKILLAGIMLKRSEFLAWINGSVVLGAAMAAMALWLATSFKRRWQALVALCCLILIGLVEAAWPLQSATTGVLSLFRWRYGHVQDFNGLTQLLSQVWPFLAGGYLFGVIWRDSRRAGERRVLR